MSHQHSKIVVGREYAMEHYSFQKGRLACQVFHMVDKMNGILSLFWLLVLVVTWILYVILLVRIG
jgi:hypothetical protein